MPRKYDGYAREKETTTGVKYNDGGSDSDSGGNGINSRS